MPAPLPRRGGDHRARPRLLALGIASAVLVACAGPASAQWRPERASAFAAVPSDDFWPRLFDDPRREPSPFTRKRKSVAEGPPLQMPPGPMHIVVSIADQRVTLYGNGAVVAQAPVSTGVPGHPTPTGVFSVIGKHKWHYSNLYSAAPMYYMERITWSGVALHAGVLPGHPASHGCIRMPLDFAIQLWGITKLGVRVIVTHNDVAPVEIADPRLFVPAPPKEAPTAAPEVSAPEVVKKADQGTAVYAASTPMADAPAGPLGLRSSGHARNKGAKLARELARRTGPVSVFVSRKERRLYVRRAFLPVFDVPLEIRDPDKPLGTHVFTAMEVKDKAVRWTVISMPSEYPRTPERVERRSARVRGGVAKPVPPIPPVAAEQTASEALARIVMPPAAVDRIAAMLTQGASLIISDYGLGPETGKETDFIILTRQARK